MCVSVCVFVPVHSWVHALEQFAREWKPFKTILNPVTALACTFSGLKRQHIHLQSECFWNL